jgi:serine/threonine protein kinase
VCVCVCVCVCCFQYRKLTICHLSRDIKPENLLLTEPSIDSDAKLCDFGFAVELKSGELITDVRREKIAIFIWCVVLKQSVFVLGVWFS